MLLNEQEQRDAEIKRVQQDLMDIRRELGREREERISADEQSAGDLKADIAQTQSLTQQLYKGVNEALEEQRRNTATEIANLQANIQQLSTALEDTDQQWRLSHKGVSELIEANSQRDNGFARSIAHVTENHQAMLERLEHHLAQHDVQIKHVADEATKVGESLVNTRVIHEQACANWDATLKAEFAKSNEVLESFRVSTASSLSRQQKTLVSEFADVRVHLSAVKAELKDERQARIEADDSLSKTIELNWSKTMPLHRSVVSDGHKWLYKGDADRGFLTSA